MRVRNFLQSRSKIFLIGLILFVDLFFNTTAWAYPEFIGYKYTSCMTCHYNGNGSGPLNDYGRAVWASEIAGRMFAGNKTPEDLANSSGFLGTTKLPWWIRPGITSRGLVYQTDPGLSSRKTRSILMQADANLALLFTKKQTVAFVGSFGYAPTPQNQGQGSPPSDQKNWISREHYFRVQATKNLWLYAGMLDKVYGIRIVDHTAYSRAMTGVAQNDQSHSVIMQYIQPSWELSLDAFFGNLYQEADLRQKGGSMMFEYDVEPFWRIGFSALDSKDSFVENKRFALHSRNGLGEGSAILFEVGLIDNTPTNGTAKTSGYYVYSEAIQKLTRGYHLFVDGQAYKDDFSAPHSDFIKAGAGLLVFPMDRVEFRLEFQDARDIEASTTSPDAWVILSQLHLAL